MVAAGTRCATTYRRAGPGGRARRPVPRGFEAVADPADQHVLTIMCPLGSEQREEVRVILENDAARPSTADQHVPDGPVRFVDER